MADCLLIVDGEEFIDAPCRFTPIGDDGSFEIMSGNGQYFAQVNIDRAGQATGYWNGEAYADHAQDDLGTLSRQEGCWVNDRASVCAW